MLPAILGGAALVGGALWLFGHEDKGASGNVPPAIVKAIAAALKSGDPTVMHAVAVKLRSEGYAQQAASLESAAKELQAAINATPASAPGRRTERSLNPAPRADDPDARRQAGQLAQLLSGMSPAEARTSDVVQAAVKDFQLLERARKFYVGNIDGLYGPKSALVLAQDHGIVPPQPLFWPKKDKPGSQANYRAQLARFADADPQRREEWQQAMHVD